MRRFLILWILVGLATPALAQAPRSSDEARRVVMNLGIGQYVAVETRSGETLRGDIYFRSCLRQLPCDGVCRVPQQELLKQPDVPEVFMRTSILAMVILSLSAPLHAQSTSTDVIPANAAPV